jgi:peptidoglycan hydrolase CwlO-like protein
MQLKIIEIITLCGGTSGLTSLFQYLITAKIQRKKERAFEVQETQKGIQERANSVEKTQEIYDKLTERMDQRYLEMQGEINTLKKEVNQYKLQCANCKNNKL